MSSGAWVTFTMLAVWAVVSLGFAVWREIHRQRNLEAHLEIREMFEPPWLQPHHVVEIVNRTRRGETTDVPEVRPAQAGQPHQDRAGDGGTASGTR